MRGWVRSAACRGETRLMFDPDHIKVALALCDQCPVLPECVDDYQQWPTEYVPAMVIAGLDRHHTAGGKPRYRTIVEKQCRTCGVLFRVEPGSTRRYCRSHYDPGPAPVDDLAVLAGTLNGLLRREGLAVDGWRIET